MSSGIDFLKRAFSVGVFGFAIFFAASITANAQYRDNDSYHGRQNDGYYNQNRRVDKHHQKHEKHDIRDHQREEREYYGNSRELRRHQQQERRELKWHQRNEGRGGYDNRRRNNDDRYDDDHHDDDYHDH